MVKISVIVPVYNVAGYLEKCLDSLVNQTLKEIEIIVVNDGSTDESPEIIQKFVQQYSDKIIALDKKMAVFLTPETMGCLMQLVST